MSRTHDLQHTFPSRPKHVLRRALPGGLVITGWVFHIATLRTSNLSTIRPRLVIRLLPYTPTLVCCY